jgi:hypothetical protein
LTGGRSSNWSSMWSSKPTKIDPNKNGRERRKWSSSGRKDHWRQRGSNTELCKELNQKLGYHVVKEQLVFTVGQRPTCTSVTIHREALNTVGIYSKGVYTSLTSLTLSQEHLYPTVMVSFQLDGDLLLSSLHYTLIEASMFISNVTIH